MPALVQIHRTLGKIAAIAVVEAAVHSQVDHGSQLGAGDGPSMICTISVASKNFLQRCEQTSRSCFFLGTLKMLPYSSFVVDYEPFFHRIVEHRP